MQGSTRSARRQKESGECMTFVVVPLGRNGLEMVGIFELI